MYTKHFSGKHNDQNFGVGLRIKEDDEYSYQIGTYKNSAWRRSNYAIVDYTPYTLVGTRLGVFAGIVTGYKQMVVPVGGGLLARVQLGGPLEVTARFVPPMGDKKFPGVVSLEAGYSF